MERTTVVVSDAHLGVRGQEGYKDFQRFVEKVPEIGGHLLINGDLFEFWFEYRSVMPRHAFRTVAALARLVQDGVQLTVLGGNHDRWGLDFWPNEVGAEFYRGSAVLDLTGWTAYVAHGDGLVERGLWPRLLHSVTRLRLAEAAFRAIHPDLGFRIAKLFSNRLADKGPTGQALDRVAATQFQLARQILNNRGNIELVIFGHTHAARNERLGERKRFLNPGAWCAGQRYATISSNGIKLLSFHNLG